MIETEDLITPRIHLIEYKILFEENKLDPSIWESGYWLYLDEADAAGLVGGGIYFHKAAKDASYFGGMIVGYRVASKKERRPGSIIFLFKPFDNFQGLSAGTDNWEPDNFRPYRKIVR